MKFFSRMMMVVALLAVLAYGSFAFGKYVLSAKLFGDDANSSSLRNVARSTTEASAVTRQTGWKGTKPRVDVKVLPADNSSVADVPAFADEDGFSKQQNDDDNSERSTRRAPKVEEPAPAPKLGTRKFDDASVEYTLGSEKNDEDRSRSSRRRRRRSHSRSTEKPDSETRKTSEQNAGDSAEVTARSTSESGSDSAESSSSGSSSSSSSSSRERSSNSNSSDRPRESTRGRERPRRQSSDSPVPRPEGSGSSGGGDSASISPVPQPE